MTSMRARSTERSCWSTRRRYSSSSSSGVYDVRRRYSSSGSSSYSGDDRRHGSSYSSSDSYNPYNQYGTSDDRRRANAFSGPCSQYCSPGLCQSSTCSACGFCANYHPP
mmetsp:Transcript_47872/g.154381  ORF Transcript_47872/g.154381 Transcript_47872/m.154381 type:complete len:109 (+) Transcript_47872:281-607(+)